MPRWGVIINYQQREACRELHLLIPRFHLQVRAQVSVLKKAVLDEQTRSSELKEHLKTKDQTLRKHGQELESLNFRNQQLTKRVTVLQEELDSYQVSSSYKSWQLKVIKRAVFYEEY